MQEKGSGADVQAVNVMQRPELLAAPVLAFVGDAVFHLAIRSLLVCTRDANVNTLHFMSTKRVCASAQAGYADAVFDALSEDEKAVFSRGLSAKMGAMPKHCTPAQYRSATAFEAVLGYLQLKGDAQRVQELIALAIERYPIADKPIARPYKG